MFFFTLLGLLALVGLAMIHPATRHVVGNTIAGLGLFAWAGIRTALRVIPIFGWIMLMLTIVAAIGITLHSLTVMTVVAILSGGMFLILRAPFLLLPKPPVPQAGSQPSTWANVCGLSARTAKHLGGWAALLFWIAALMLFLPDVTTNVSMAAITIVTLCAVILKIVGRFRWFDKVLVGTTVAMMAVVVAVNLVAPLRHLYTDWRFANKNQMAVVLTTESIEELEQRKIEHPLEWTTNDQSELAKLVDLEDHQQANVNAAGARRGNLIPSISTGWLDDMDSFEILLIFVVLALAVAIILPVLLPDKSATTTTSHP